jgi:tetratricopeptide (TPR) repeat protein
MGMVLDTTPGTSRDSNGFFRKVPPHNHWLSPAVCLFLALMVWFVFGQTLHHKFVNYDDDVYVYENPMVIQGLTWHGAVWAFTHKHDVNWHPLTTLSHMLDCQIDGLHPGGHHLTNVLLHMAAVILLFLMLRDLTGAFWRSAFVAAVFAIHPLRVESVAWVAERKDVLSGVFFMLTLWAYTRYARRPKTGNYLAVLFLFALGLMSKPMLVTLPFVLLLLDYWPLHRVPGWRRLILEKVPFLILAIAACVVTVLVQQEAIKSFQALSFPWRIANALVSYAAYIGQMFWPAGLAVIYPHPGSHLPVWEIGLSVLVLVVVTAAVLAGWGQRPYLLVGWLWYLGMLVPVIGLMQVGDQARADRYTYLPQIGLYMAMAWGVVELCGSWRYLRVVLGSAAGVIVVVLMAAAYIQTGYWADSTSLWTHTLACTSGNYVAHNNLGIALADQGKLPEAIEHYKQALQFKPNFTDATLDLGIALAQQGKMQEATRYLWKAVRLKPQEPKEHCNLGNALAEQGQYPEAIQQYQEALRLKPDYAHAANNLAGALETVGRLDEALAEYEAAVRLEPGAAVTRCNFGCLLVKMGRRDEAMVQFKETLRLQPDNATARVQLQNLTGYASHSSKAKKNINVPQPGWPPNRSRPRRLSWSVPARASGGYWIIRGAWACCFS